MGVSIILQRLRYQVGSRRDASGRNEIEGRTYAEPTPCLQMQCGMSGRSALGGRQRCGGPRDGEWETWSW